MIGSDGSKSTQKALKFTIDQKRLNSAQSELLVVHVQPMLPTFLSAIVSVGKTMALQEVEQKKVFSPIRKLLDKNNLKYRCIGLIGSVANRIAATAEKEQVNLIVMGTHGRDYLGSAVMGSVAQKVLAYSTIPVLLVK